VRNSKVSKSKDRGTVNNFIHFMLAMS